MRRAMLLLLFLTGCNEMQSQPRDNDYRASALFPDGKVMQAPPDHTVARDDPERDAELATRPPLTLALLQRGRERYGVYCTPCHDAAGTGNGTVPARGFPHPPNFHLPPLDRVSSRHIVDVISHGYGVMYPYADRVQPADRWAIAAYVHALQLSQNAPEASLPADERTQLEAVHAQ